MAPRHSRVQYPPTLMVVIASIFSAVVVTACGPDDEGPATRAAVNPPAAVQTAQPRQAAPAPEVRQRPAASPDLGEVRGIEPIKSRPKATGAGAAIGGVAGGLLGHQIGNGSGNTVATVAGAVGGAVAGHQIEKHRAEKVVGYRVRVRLDTGDIRTVRTDRLDGLRVGDRVRVDRETQQVHRV
jgi:outer membrane lipoprotein SlyB